MHEGRFVFAQLMDYFPQREFQQCVERYRGNYRLRRFSCRDQFLAMTFGQLTYRASLRNIETCLRAMRDKLYHAGFRATVARNTLARANELRDWRIYHDFAQALIRRARKLYANEPLAVALDNTVYALDSTIVELCLSLFPWAHAAASKGHHQAAHAAGRTGRRFLFCPCFHGKNGRFGHLGPIGSRSGIVLHPRPRLQRLRATASLDARRRFLRGAQAARTLCSRERRSARSIDVPGFERSNGDVQGPTNERTLSAPVAAGYFFRRGTRRRFILLTNAFHLPAPLIPQLYKCRWQVELFFKWIKQHLRIKHFFGTSPNAVKTQVWIAISAYVLVAILKRELKLSRSQYEILQILSVALFEKTPDFAAFLQQSVPNSQNSCHNQLSLFDF